MCVCVRLKMIFEQVVVIAVCSKKPTKIFNTLTMHKDATNNISSLKLSERDYNVFTITVYHNHRILPRVLVWSYLNFVIYNLYYTMSLLDSETVQLNVLCAASTDICGVLRR